MQKVYDMQMRENAVVNFEPNRKVLYKVEMLSDTNWHVVTVDQAMGI